MEHSCHFYAACLDHHSSQFSSLPHAIVVEEEEDDDDNIPPSALCVCLSRLQYELAQFESWCDETWHASDSKVSETDAMREHVAILEARLLQFDHLNVEVKDQLWGLEEEMAQLQADRVVLQL